MKKQLIVTLAILVCLSIFMVGCGNDNGNGNGNGNDYNDYNGEELILYDFDLSQYVTIGSIRGLEIRYEDMPRTEVTDEEIEEEIQRMFHALDITGEQVFEGVVALGDNANIDYIGTRDGIAFPGGTAFGQYLGIGSGRFIPGFEEQLIGVAIGDTVVIDVTFPDPYFPNPDLAGVVVQFEVTINHVSLPTELTDEIVQEFMGANSIEELREELRHEINEWLTENYTRILHGVVWGTIVGNATILQYPMKEVNAVFSQRRSEEETAVEAAGLTWEQFLAQVGASDLEVNEFLLDQARDEVRQNMVLLATARQEGIELTDEEVDAGILRLLNEIDIESEDEFRDIVGESFIEFHGRQTTEFMILFRKIMDIAIETMVIVE